MSDLHIGAKDAGAPRPPGDTEVPDADLCVIAGDVTDGAIEALEWIAQTIALHMPVALVLGNHEFHGETWEVARAESRKVANMIVGVTLLDDDVAIIGGVRFIGGTLWSDYQLHSRGDEALRRRAMAAAKRLMPDHSRIDVQAPSHGVINRRFSPRDAREAHIKTRAFLDLELAKPFDGPTVVVTHHAPHPLCIHPRFQDDALSPAFASDLTELINKRRPRLWVHGHVHDPVDVRVGDTRIVCNPRGYPDQSSGFDPCLVVKV